MKLLLIEDDQVIVSQLVEELDKVGYQVDFSYDGEEGLYRSKEYEYDLAIIDLGLPKLSGLDVIKRLRASRKTLPILILTARSGWQDKVHGLKAGADDYLVKPFQMEELIARVEAMLRRAGGYASNQLAIGPLKLDLDIQELYVNESPIKLTMFEYKLIRYFMMHPQRVASKAVLAEHLYDDETDPDSNVIEVIVARLRQKIDPKNKLKPIETLRGRGYRFVLKSSPT